MDNPLKKWRPSDIPSQRGKRVVITGASSGIGWETALELARAGAFVYIPARTKSKSEDAAVRIRTQVPSAQVKTGVLDLSSLASVRSFATEVSSQAEPVDSLINNAGVMAIQKRTLSVDGFELQFASNVLGHFLLTGLLLPKLLDAPAPRVVTVSSSVHELSGPLDLDNLNSEKSYKWMKSYSQTKLMNLLFTSELQRRAGSRLLAVSVHPGYAKTNLLFRDPSLVLKIMTAVFWPVSQSAAQGAWPSLYAATATDVEPGGYYGPDGFNQIRGNVKRAKTAKQANDDVAAKELFVRLEELAGVHYAL